MFKARSLIFHPNKFDRSEIHITSAKGDVKLAKAGKAEKAEISLKSKVKWCKRLISDGNKDFEKVCFRLLKNRFKT